MIKRYRQDQIKELANILKKDGVISVPTDTVFGVCARINSKKAYDRLIEVKNRPKSKLFPIMCSDERQIKSIAMVDDRSEKLIHSFMPGPITLILYKKNEIPEYITNEGRTLAIRMAPSKVIEDLIKETKSPIFMSSANKSGEPTCTNLEEIEKKCPLLDGMMEGDVLFGEASTIVDCTSKELKILRQGPITIEQLNEVTKKK